MEKLNRSDCVVFPLVLKRKWYDMIASGEKTEEYRDMTPRYDARFRNLRTKCIDRDVDIYGHGFMRPMMGRGRAIPDAVVAFSIGYTKPDMFFTVKFSLARWWPPLETTADNSEYWSPVVVRNSPLHPEWGEPDYPHYVIKLSERILC